MIDTSMIAATAWSAGRALIAALLATGLGVVIARGMRRAAPLGRWAQWLLLLAVIVSPDLVSGYAYRNFSLSLARWPLANEAMVMLLIAAKSTAVAAVIALLSPEAALSPGGRHTLRLAGGRIGWPVWLRILARGRLDRLAPILAISFVFAFQQFELPSLTTATAWTVTMFDRQAMLPDLSDSADPLIWPLLVELLVLAPLVLFLARAVGARQRAIAPVKAQILQRLAGWAVVIIIALFSVAIPWSILTSEALQGVGYFGRGGPAVFSYTRQIGTALLYGGLSGAIAWLVALGLLRLIAAPRWRIPGAILMALVCLPGLCGSLIPSLFALVWLQEPWLLPLRNTIVPVITVLALMLIPRAVLLEILFRLDARRSALALARMLRRSPDRRQRRGGRAQEWSLWGFGRTCRLALLMYWGYLDLTVSQMLAPVGMESVTLWLYNFMHYGRNARLSAMTFVAVAVPVALFFSVLLVRRFFAGNPLR